MKLHRERRTVDVSFPVIVVLSFTRIRRRKLPINFVLDSRHRDERRNYSILGYTLN